MGVVISKPAINLREQLTELKAQQGYEERQFHFDNLVTNGTFDADTSGWTASNAVISWDTSGYIVVDDTANAGPDSNASQTITTVVGKQYVLSVDRISTTSAFWLEVQGLSQLVYTGSLGTTTGPYSVTFVADSTSTIIRLISSGTGVTKYDNVSVYTSDGTDVAFAMPKGWKPLHVYDDGVLQREGSAEDYEVTFDGFNYYVKPTVANPGARNTVIGVRA